MAPEIVLQEDYNEKADVFSFAIILWELVTREDPYPNMTGLALAYAVANDGLRPEIPAYCPQEIADLIVRCWDADQHKRPGFEEILEYIQGIQTSIRKLRKQRQSERRTDSLDELETISVTSDFHIQVSDEILESVDGSMSH